MRVAVVVLGDLGRSPRALHHAYSLADRGVDVDLLGYGGSVPQLARTHSRISCVLLDEPSTLPGRGIGYLVAGAWRAVLQGARLTRLLLARPRPDVLLVQTPPAVPTLLAVALVARLRSSRLVIDWHNLTCSLVALRCGPRHPGVALVAAYERVCGRLADAHLCVSTCMQHALADRWGIRATVFRDRPRQQFAPVPEPDRSALVRRVLAEAGVPLTRPTALVLVPTSWSLDDDIDLLLAAADTCEQSIANRSGGDPAFPRANPVILITGRGPLRSRYEPRLAARQARHVHVRSVWLSEDDYTRLIGCADLGLSLHRSASGLDLPMKIADLFGGSVAVCALDYGPCLREVVRDGDNGMLFTTSTELARHLSDLVDPDPACAARFARLRAGAEASAAVRWEDGWAAEAWPVLSTT